MTHIDAATLRVYCQIHALKRGLERGIPLDCAAIARLEERLDQLRPAFEQPGRDRYRLYTRVAGVPVRVLYDVRLRCLVTVWRRFP